ncbi:MAG: signal peptide peptidase SppA [Halobacteriovoraceae bacterium]|nr:signal peptide peptidase SppA [Halobacteriovoraceae bacterium]
MKEINNRALYGILLMVFLFFILLMIFAVYTMRAFVGSTSAEVDIAEHESSIAVVEIDGVLLKSKEIIEKLHIAESAKNIKAIIVRINSPGGAVGPVQEIYQEIRRIDKKRPVYASFSAIAASGGYYVGAATRKIFSNPGTLTGSIGVLMQFIDLSRLYQWMKISPNTIKSGRYKDIGGPGRPMTSEEKGIMQNLLKGVHRQFINDIVKIRKDKIKKDIETLAQGQIFSGEEAFKHGLVDDLASLWEAGRKIHEELKIKGKFGLRFIKKRKDLSFWEILENLDKSIFQLGLKVKTDPTPVPMYL